MDFMAVLKISVVGILSLITISCVFYKMNPGMGNYNFKTIVMVFSISIIAILAVMEVKAEALTPAFSLLGSIVGYIFGMSSKSNSTEGK
jgi:hypothetical protein